MTEELENQEEIEEEYDTSESDYITDEPDETHIGNWDGETHPDQIDNWETPEDREDALEMWKVDNPEPWDGRSRPDESQFETYDEYEEAKDKHRIAQATKNLAQGQITSHARAAAELAASEHPAETDKNYDQKAKLIEQIHTYAAKSDKAQREGDFKKANDFEGYMRNYASELSDLAKPRQATEAAAQRKRVTADRTAFLDHWTENPGKWKQKITEVGADKMAADAETYARQAAENSDDGTLYLVIGHSKTGLDGEPRLFKIDVPAQVKHEILSRLSWDDVTIFDAAKTHPAIADQIPDAAELPDVDLTDDTQLKALTAPEAEKLSQADFERWRILNGARQPKYHRIIPGRPKAI